MSAVETKFSIELDDASVITRVKDEASLSVRSNAEGYRTNNEETASESEYILGFSRDEDLDDDDDELDSTTKLIKKDCNEEESNSCLNDLPPGNSNSDASQEPRVKYPFVCVVCGKDFLYKNYLIAHRKVHKDEKPFQCNVCGKTFQYQNHVKTHMRSHQRNPEEQPPLVCQECGKTFNLKASLVSHLQTHSKYRPYACPECGKAFRKKNALVVHIQTHNKPVKLLNCEDCGKTFPNRARLAQHKRLCEMGLHEIFERAAEELSNAEKGIPSDLAQRRYVCDDCGKSYKYRTNLTDHMRTHSNERPHICKDCGKTFVRKCNYLQHLLRHSGVT